jgi:hypothetical protein
MTLDLFQDRRTLLYLFIALRMTLLLIFPPQLVETPPIERGLSYQGDFYEHYKITQEIDANNLPYKEYWVEFPPVWPGLSWLASELSSAREGDFTGWGGLLFLVMLAFDCGNLLFIWRLGDRLHGEGAPLAWIYALMATPLVMIGWNFEVIVLFTMLAGFAFYLEGRSEISAGWITFGVLTKYIPILLLPTVWRFSARNVAFFYTAIVLIGAGIVLIPLVLWGGEMAVTSLTVQFNKPSYQTAWALLDGNFITGSLPVGEARYDADASAVQQRGEPALIPGWLRLIPFAALGLWIFSLPLAHDDLTKLAFFSLTVTLFMLWSQGWSPQWVVILIPLILLNIPSRLGVLLCLTLSIGAFLEYPLLFRAAGDVRGVLENTARLPFGLLVLTRTLLLAGFSGTMIQKLRTTS